MPSTARVSTGPGLLAPPLLDLGGTALFADLDGTLAPIAPTPADVGPDRRRTQLLQRLSRALGGRLAVISGRALDDLDRVLDGGVTAVAATHGLVRRTATGEVLKSDGRLPGAVRKAVEALARDHPSLLVEDKGPAIALHYRADPDAGPLAEAAARDLADRHGLALQRGRMVAELRAPGPTKADAVRSFMGEPPFAGASPVFIGDDLTDEDGFAAAEALGGYGVIVGPRRPTTARYALAGVGDALAWLERALEQRA